MDQIALKQSRPSRDGIEPPAYRVEQLKDSMAALAPSERSSQSSEYPPCNMAHIKQPDGEPSNDIIPKINVNGYLSNSKHTNGHAHDGEHIDLVERGTGVPIAICGMAFRLPGGLSTSQ